MPGDPLALPARQVQVTDGPLPCQRQSPQLWFSDLPADLELAKAHCAPCPLRGSCLAGALERHEPHGVWGGEIFIRGTVTARKRPRGRPRNTPQEDSMHPLILQQLAADRGNEMIADADSWRQARQARRARRSRTSGPTTRHGQPRTQAEPRRASAGTAVAASPAPHRPARPAGDDQGRELALAERGRSRTR
jgi:WhiB family redox-sensing transcriptional regulator